MKKLFCIPIFASVFIHLVAGDCKLNFECTSSHIGASEFCTKECELSPDCGEDPVDDNCEDGEFMQLYDNPKDFCNCCPPKCIKYKKEGDDCEPTVSDRVPTEMCGPRLGNRISTNCRICTRNFLD